MIQRLPTVQLSVYQQNDKAPATIQLSVYLQNDTAPADCTADFISAKRYSTFRLYSCLYISKTIQHLPTVQLSLYQQNDT